MAKDVPDESRSREDRIDEAIADYLQRIDRGQSVDLEAFLQKHGDLRQDLEDFLRNLRLVDRQFVAPLQPEEQRIAGAADLDSPSVDRNTPSNWADETPGLEQVSSGGPDDTVTGMPRWIGRFAIQRPLGRGGFGAVYLARDPELKREVAVKVPRAERCATDEDVELLLREARSAAQLQHPGIVTIFDVGRDGPHVYIVQQYIPGEDLANRQKTQALNLEQIVALIAGVAEAIAFAHQKGFVHRDLKPGNILLDEQGRPHVADFGLAVHETAQRRRRGERSGTPAYMSPEQVRGETHRLDGRADLWSIGVILYELLAGKRPFKGNDQEELFDEIQHRQPKPLRMIKPEIPCELERICLKCLAKEAVDRYTTAADLAADLRRLMKTAATVSGRNWGRSIVVGGVLAAVIVIALIASYGRRPSASSMTAVGHDVLDTSSGKERLRVESIQFEQLSINDQGEHERRGRVLADPYVLRLGDAVQFRAHLTRSAYCYWIALRPDGVEELCFPQSEHQPPPLTDSPTYPVQDTDRYVYGLTDRIGTQVFALVISENPLPPYSQWRARLGACPWKPAAAPAEVILHHDGKWEESFSLHAAGLTRGAGEAFKGGGTLSNVARWLAQDQNIAAIDVWALPVLPRSGRSPIPHDN